MKKQYKYKHTSRLMVYVQLYHDGKLIETKKALEGDEVWDMLDKLESDGYTYGYTKDEVEKEKRKYEHMLANIIEVKDE